MSGMRNLLDMIISYATKNNFAGAAARLVNNCDELGIPHFINIIDDSEFSNEIAKRMYKPRFIRETIEYFGEPVIWVDVDSKILKPFTPNWNFDFGYIQSVKKNPKRWIADSIHFHNVSNIRFLKAWEIVCEERKFVKCHDTLIATCRESSSNILMHDASYLVRGKFIRNFGLSGEIKY